MTTSRRNILVVDDESPVRLSLAAYLEDEGYTVQMAGSAEEALSLCEVSAPDLAIVDLRLPGMDGASLITEMAAAHPKVRFIIHTGSTKFSLPEEFKDKGITNESLFFKPVLDMAEMTRKIASLLKE